MKSFFRLLVLLNFLWLFAVNSKISYAENRGQGIEVYPAYLEVSLNQPNEDEKVILTYVNHTEEPIALQISALDFKQKDYSGEIDLIKQLNQEGNYSYGLSSFLSFEADTINLAPHEKRNFNIDIRNRQDIGPGGHYAAVIAKSVPTFGPTDGGTHIVPSIASLLLLKKSGGEIFRSSIIDLDWPKFSAVFSLPRVVTLTFQNEGNIHVIPYGSIKVIDEFGRQVMGGQINPSSEILLPSAKRYYKIEMRPTDYIFPISYNNISVQGQDSLKKNTYFIQKKFLYIDPMIFVLFFVLIILLFNRGSLQKIIHKVFNLKKGE